jgi:predicted nucleotidyltransferase
MKPARFGISQAHWDLISRIALLPIRTAGGKVWVFGSRARGDYREFSDLDLLLEGFIGPALVSSIAEQLEESTLPFRVDLVQEQDLAETYREGVLKDRVAVE